MAAIDQSRVLTNPRRSILQFALVLTNGAEELILKFPANCNLYEHISRKGATKELLLRISLPPLRLCGRLLHQSLYP